MRGVRALADAERVVSLRKRLLRSRRKRLSFLLLIVLGFSLPCGLFAFILKFPVDDGVQIMMTVSVLVLPIIGVFGALSMTMKVSRITRKLAEARKALADKVAHDHFLDVASWQEKGRSFDQTRENI